MARGRLITIEGIDGAGKTTLAARLAEDLRRPDRSVELLREPGGVVTSERIRTLVKDPGARIGARAEALLYAAARAQLVEERISPLLEHGMWVLLDRFVDSSLAYQGAGRELGVDAVAAINAFATGSLAPDRTLLLRISPAAGRERQGGRDGPGDRLELEEDSFFARIAGAYDALAASESERFRVIDASRSPEEVHRAALAALTGLTPDQSP